MPPFSKPLKAKVQFIRTVQRPEQGGNTSILGAPKFYTLYEFQVSWHDGTPPWTITKRYNEFDELKRKLRELDTPGRKAIDLPLPEKRWLGKNSVDTVRERKDGLVNFLTAVLQSYDDAPVLHDFLNKPRSRDTISFVDAISGSSSLLHETKA